MSTNERQTTMKSAFVNLYRVYNLRSGLYETVSDNTTGAYRVGVWTSREAAAVFATTESHVVVTTPYARQSVSRGRVVVAS